MERSLPQIAGAWRPLGDSLGCPFPPSPPISGEPGPPLGKDRPGRLLQVHVIWCAIKAAQLSESKLVRFARPVDPSRSFGTSDLKRTRVA